MFLYDNHKIAEARNGSGTVVQQFIHGTQYIDELVMTRVKDKGEFYIHQDANWNVIAATDQGGRLLERYEYTPYGEVTVHQKTAFGDRDGDLDVDSTDKGTVGVTCTGTLSGSCRIMDLDFDGDYDATDATKFDALTSGMARHPGRTTTGVLQLFGHHSLFSQPETNSLQNRVREYFPNSRVFIQRDPRGYRDGLQVYLTLAGNPANRLDAFGLSSDKCNKGECGSGDVGGEPPPDEDNDDEDGDDPPDCVDSSECPCRDHFELNPGLSCGIVLCDSDLTKVPCVDSAGGPSCGSTECICAHEQSHIACNTSTQCSNPLGIPTAATDDTCEALGCHRDIFCAEASCQFEHGEVTAGNFADSECTTYTWMYLNVCLSVPVTPIGPIFPVEYWYLPEPYSGF